MSNKIVNIELIDGCHLKCLLCWNNTRKCSFDQISISTFEKIMKKYGDYILELYNWGEPLLYKKFEEISSIIKGTNSNINSTLSLPISDKRLESLQNFTNVRISLSGMTPEIYNIFHVGGDLKLVINNLERLSKINCRNISILWYLHKYNKLQYSLVYQLSVKYNFYIEKRRLSPFIYDKINENKSELIDYTRRVMDKDECPFIKNIVFDVYGNHLICCKLHDIKIGYTIDDDISDEELTEVKRNTEFCKICHENKFWNFVQI